MRQAPHLSRVQNRPKSTRGDDYQAVPRPVAAMARDLPSDYEIAWHKHPRYQLSMARKA